VVKELRIAGKKISVGPGFLKEREASALTEGKGGNRGFEVQEQGGRGGRRRDQGGVRGRLTKGLTDPKKRIVGQTLGSLGAKGKTIGNGPEPTQNKKKQAIKSNRCQGAPRVANRIGIGDRKEGVSRGDREGEMERPVETRNTSLCGKVKRRRRKEGTFKGVKKKAWVGQKKIVSSLHVYCFSLGESGVGGVL